MNCPNCNAPVTEDSAFCPECGAKVEAPVQAPEAPAAPAAPAAFCPECGAAMAPGAAFCENCGAKTEEVAPEAPAEKKSLSKWLKLGIAAVALVAIVVLIISLFGGSKPNFALYRKDSDLFYSKLSGKPTEINDEYTNSHWMNKDGSKLFYLEDGKLYVRNLKKAKAEPQQLAKGVSDYRITEDGSKVFYMKSGDLRWCDLKDNGEKIASNVIDWTMTKDGKTLIYVVSGDDKVELHRATVSGKRVKSEKIASGYDIDLHDMSENGKTVIYTVVKEDSSVLYSQTGKKDPVKIASDIKNVYPVYDNGSFYYTVSDEVEDEDGYTSYETKLCFWNGKKSTDVAKDIDYVRTYASEAAVLVYTVTEETDDDYETLHYVAVKAKASELKLEDVYSVSIKPNGKEMLIVANYDDEDECGTLYKAAIGNAVKEPKKVKGAEDVAAAGYTPDGKKTMYLADLDTKDYTYTLYVEGKKIAEDVFSMDYNEESGMLIYMTDRDGDEFTLWSVKGSKGKKINDDVYDYQFTPDGTLLYLCDQDNGEGDLYKTTGGEGKKIDTEVTALIYVNYYAD